MITLLDMVGYFVIRGVEGLQVKSCGYNNDIDERPMELTLYLYHMALISLLAPSTIN
jgi:hypothetical protein